MYSFLAVLSVIVRIIQCFNHLDCSYFNFSQQPNALFATLTGATGFQVQAQPIELTEKQIRQALESAYGDFHAELVNILVPDWASNPLYFGTYSSPKVNVTKH